MKGVLAHAVIDATGASRPPVPWSTHYRKQPLRSRVDLRCWM